MKKFLLKSLAFFILQSATGQTNVYHPFPESNAVWNIDFQIYACQWFPFVHEERYSYVIAGDTVVGANVYHKIMRPFVQMVDTCWGNFPMNNSGYMGCYRQDTSARKIFFLDNGTSVEEVLYDFSLNQGDTVVSYLGGQAWCGPNTTTVTNVDSIIINGSYRKRWEWTNWGFGGSTTTVIEGIGSVSGLLEPSCQLIDGPVTYLSCFIEDNVVAYVHPTYPDSSCLIIDAIKESTVNNMHHEIIISPNPFHTSAALEIKSEELKSKNYELKIYNTLGVLVQIQQISNQRSAIINRTGLTDGLYFFGLLSSDYTQHISGKFVVE